MLVIRKEGDDGLNGAEGEDEGVSGSGHIKTEGQGPKTVSPFKPEPVQCPGSLMIGRDVIRIRTDQHNGRLPGSIWS